MNYCLFRRKKKYSSQIHSVINDCYTRITHLGDLDISIDLLNISSKFLLHLRVLLTITQGHIKISK
jgi:hypothetical protein